MSHYIHLIIYISPPCISSSYQKIASWAKRHDLPNNITDSGNPFPIDWLPFLYDMFVQNLLILYSLTAIPSNADYAEFCMKGRNSSNFVGSKLWSLAFPKFLNIKQPIYLPLVVQVTSGSQTLENGLSILWHPRINAMLFKEQAKYLPQCADIAKVIRTNKIDEFQMHMTDTTSTLGFTIALEENFSSF